MYNWFNYSRLKKQFENQLKENAELREENKNLEDILNSIGEDGTIEHNNAIKLRQENVKLNLRITELTKEVLGLRHLKTENVELIEKLQKEGDSYGMTFNEAKTQIIQNDYKKCAEERDEYKHQLNAANKEIEALRSKLRVYQDKYAESFSYNDMNGLQKEIDKLTLMYKEREAKLKAYNRSLQSQVTGLKEDNEKLVKDEPQKHPMYPLHWGGYDKNIIDFVESEFNNEDPLEGKRVTAWCYKCQYTTGQCKCDKNLSIQSLPKSFPNEFQEKSWEDAAANLALKVVKLEKKIEELSTKRAEHHD